MSEFDADGGGSIDLDEFVAVIERCIAAKDNRAEILRLREVAAKQLKALEDEAMLRSITSQLQDAVQTLNSGSEDLVKAVAASGVEITAADLVKGVNQLVEDGVKSGALEDCLRLVRDARSVCLELAKAEYVQSVLKGVTGGNDNGNGNGDGDGDGAAASTSNGENADIGVAVASDSQEFMCLKSVVALQPDLGVGSDRERAEERKRKAREMVASGDEVPAEGTFRRM